MQTAASTIIQFVVQIVDSCNTATVTYSSAPGDMSNTVTKAAVVQTFAATDSVSVASGTPGVCGLYTYSIDET